MTPTPPVEALEWCDAVKVVGHERFACHRLANHDNKHAAVRREPPCPACGGYDEHAAGCLSVGDTRSTHDVEFEWE